MAIKDFPRIASCSHTIISTTFILAHPTQSYQRESKNILSMLLPQTFTLALSVSRTPTPRICMVCPLTMFRHHSLVHLLGFIFLINLSPIYYIHLF